MTSKFILSCPLELQERILGFLTFTELCVLAELNAQLYKVVDINFKTLCYTNKCYRRLGETWAHAAMHFKKRNVKRAKNGKACFHRFGRVVVASLDANEIANTTTKLICYYKWPHKHLDLLSDGKGIFYPGPKGNLLVYEFATNILHSRLTVKGKYQFLGTCVLDWSNTTIFDFRTNIKHAIDVPRDETFVAANAAAAHDRHLVSLTTRNTLYVYDCGTWRWLPYPLDKGPKGSQVRILMCPTYSTLIILNHEAYTIYNVGSTRIQMKIPILPSCAHEPTTRAGNGRFYLGEAATTLQYDETNKKWNVVDSKPLSLYQQIKGANPKNPLILRDTRPKAFTKIIGHPQCGTNRTCSKKYGKVVWKVLKKQEAEEKKTNNHKCNIM